MGRACRAVRVKTTDFAAKEHKERKTGAKKAGIFTEGNEGNEVL